MIFELNQVRADRDCLAAAAMAFAPATEIPRQRALLRSAIHSLIQAFGDDKFTWTKAIDAIAGHGCLPELRPHVAKPLLRRLCQEGIVNETRDGNNSSYQLSIEFLQKTKGEKVYVENLLAKVVHELFAEYSLTSEEKKIIAQCMLLTIAEVMARFGKQYAYQVAGRADRSIEVDREEFISICRTVLTKNSITVISPEQLADAILELFTNKEPHFTLFVFSLTQNYFYMRLLGLAGGLEQLRENRFESAEFFLDTNIVIACLLRESRHHRSLLELEEVAKRMKVSLHVAELTLAELKGVLDYHRDKLLQTYDTVPDDLVPNTRNAFLRSYRARKQDKPNLTPQEFLASFSNSRDVLEKNWTITVLDDPVEKTIEPTEWEHTKNVLNDFSRRVRLIPKGERSLDHDAHIYHLVLTERARYGDKAAWLLTLDTSLPPAAVELQGTDAVPFAMTLDGFLQIMSPYVRADHQQTFAEMYVELVGRNLFPPEEVLRLDDFLLFTDMDLTVRTLPAEDVKRIIRKVKSSLDGKSVTDADKQKVAYEVQKALADPTLKYRVALEQEINLRDKRFSELEQAKAQEQAKHELELEKVKSELGARITETKQSYSHFKTKAEEFSQEIKFLIASTAILKHILKMTISGVILGAIVIIIWLLPKTWLSAVNNPIALRSGVSVVSLSVWIGLASKAKFLEIAAFVIAAVSALFTAWVVFF